AVLRLFAPYTYRCAAGHPDPCPVCTGAPHLEEILQYEGAHTVAAVILETVTGTNGIIVPPDGYLRSIREVCDTYGILLIADEVMAGFGRTGKWFAVDHWDVVPDIVTMAKGINSGYIPLGAMAIREPIARIGKAALERGVYLMTHWNVIMVCPPLTITREELDEGIAVLDDVLAIADEYYTG